MVTSTGRLPVANDDPWPYDRAVDRPAFLRRLSAARSHETYLATRYRRITSRRGPIKAIVAVEHANLNAIWNMITNGVFYQDLGGDYYTKLNPDKTKQRALNQLRQMGYDVTLSPLQTAVTG